MKEKEIKTFSGKVIYDALQKTSLDIEQLAEKLKLSSVAIYHWLNGKRIISFDNALSVCRILDIDESELNEAIKKDKMNIYNKKSISRFPISDNPNQTNLIRIPILGQVPAGDFREILSKMRDEAQKWEYISDDPARDEKFLFGFSVIGESMTGKDIQDGDIIIIDTSVKPINGDVVMAMMNDSTTVKTFWRSGEILTLYSANDKIDPIFFHENDKDNVKIIGKVIRVIKKL